MRGWSTSAGESVAWDDVLSFLLFSPLNLLCASLGEHHGVPRRFPVIFFFLFSVSVARGPGVLRGPGVVADMYVCEAVCGHAVGLVIGPYGIIPLGWPWRHAAAMVWRVTTSVYSIYLRAVLWLISMPCSTRALVTCGNVLPLDAQLDCHCSVRFFVLVAFVTLSFREDGAASIATAVCCLTTSCFLGWSA